MSGEYKLFVYCINITLNCTWFVFFFLKTQVDTLMCLDFSIFIFSWKTISASFIILQNFYSLKYVSVPYKRTCAHAHNSLSLFFSHSLKHSGRHLHKLALHGCWFFYLSKKFITRIPCFICLLNF